MATQNSDNNITNAPCYVIVARHGERWDYVQRDGGADKAGAGDSVNWVAAVRAAANGNATADRPWDPPLSPQGVRQATRLGQYIVKTLRERHLPPVTACYASPFLRCRQTAAAAVAAINDDDDDDHHKDKNNNNSNLRVAVEDGLAEAFNESWFRSWSLPGSDSTWGCRGGSDDDRALTDYSTAELHPAAAKPVQTTALEWKHVYAVSMGDADKDAAVDTTKLLQTHQDLDHVSSTQITEPYILHPSSRDIVLETKSQQQARMAAVVRHKAVPGRTVLLVSHGAPVTHLFEALTGLPAAVHHGPSKYACVSLYEGSTISSTDTGGTDGVDGSGETTTPRSWKPLLVNESKYLQDLWSDATANI